MGIGGGHMGMGGGHPIAGGLHLLIRLPIGGCMGIGAP